jgi:fatty-acyl-CoA synthase
MDSMDMAAPSPLGRLLREAASRYGDRPAVVSGGKGVSHRELCDQSTAVAKGLTAHGVQPGDRIGIWSPNTLESIAVQCAALRIGAVTVHFDPEWEAEQARSAIERTGVSCVVIRAFFKGRQYPAMVKSVRPQLPGLRDVFTHGRQPRFERVLPGGWLDFLDSAERVPDAALADREEQAAGPAAAPCSPAVVFFESGDASRAVGVSGSEVMRAAEELTSAPWPICAGASFCGPAALVFGCLAPLLCGGTIVLPAPEANAAGFFETLRTSACKSLVASRDLAVRLGEYGAEHPEERAAIECCWIVGAGSTESVPDIASLADGGPTAVGLDGWLRLEAASAAGSPRGDARKIGVDGGLSQPDERHTYA